MIKENRGITLVVLAISIIVLLIIVGISAFALFGNNEILSKAQESANKDHLESTKEEIKLQISEEIATNEGANPTNEVLKSILEKYGQVEYESDGVTVKGVVTTKNGYEILLLDLGTLNTSSVDNSDTVTLGYDVKAAIGSTYNILVKIGDINGIETIIYKNASGENVTLTCDSKQEIDIDYVVSSDTHYYFTVLSKTGVKVTKDLCLHISINEFSYTGNFQTFIAPYNGSYLLETWGAEGGSSYSSAWYGGKGGYSKGYVTLNAGQTIYIYVGGKGSNANTNSLTVAGWNGGGLATENLDGSGGGATDFRINGQALSNRIIVAGGGRRRR